MCYVRNKKKKKKVATWFHLKWSVSVSSFSARSFFVVLYSYIHTYILSFHLHLTSDSCWQLLSLLQLYTKNNDKFNK